MTPYLARHVAFSLALTLGSLFGLETPYLASHVYLAFSTFVKLAEPYRCSLVYLVLASV